MAVVDVVACTDAREPLCPKRDLPSTPSGIRVRLDPSSSLLEPLGEPLELALFL